MTQKLLLIIPAILLACFLTACSKPDKTTDASLNSEMGLASEFTARPNYDRAVQSETPNTPQANHSATQKLVTEGRITLACEDLEKSKKRIDTLIKTLKGHYNSENLINNYDNFTYQLTIRIPSDKNSEFTSRLISKGEALQQKEISTTDVTTTFIDNESRLQNKQNYLKRYTELLSKAHSINDIISIEERIRGLQEEIESTTATLRYLSNQVEFSTYYITLVSSGKTNTQVKKEPFVHRLINSLIQGWEGLNNLLIWIVSIWPIILLATGAVVLYRKQKIRKKKQS
ncbi:MAG: DUF4349 domain-containing protein [Bacteroidales bacterium]|nr:DUF4349 domain-containing protein [Bacteroidales bacterium]